MGKTESIIKNILLVEDCPADIKLTKVALKEIRVKRNLYSVYDGVEALKFLNQQDQYEYMPRPDIILLDLGLPRKDGWEVLKEIKNDKKLKTIPVIVITVSTDPKTIFKAYQLQANSVLIKPLDIDEFSKSINDINDFWFNTAQLPIKSLFN
jgi:two-component system response regulator